MPIKHGLARTRVYRIWAGMKARCLNQNHPKFPKYGGNGIRVCERWLDFNMFFADMGHPPSPKHSIDRKDGKKGYEPDNCKWATPREQSSHIEHTRYLTFQGNTLPLKEWERRTGIPDNTIGYRIDRGWTVEQALTLPRHTRINSHDGGWPTKRKKAA